MYQVGLMETDQHIEFFWSALEMFTQEELCKFIKFACNQERIPFTCPCKDGGPDTAHVPPYPMKIAPPDGAAGVFAVSEGTENQLCWHNGPSLQFPLFNLNMDLMHKKKKMKKEAGSYGCK